MRETGRGGEGNKVRGGDKQRKGKVSERQEKREIERGGDMRYIVTAGREREEERNRRKDRYIDIEKDREREREGEK